MAAKWLLKSDPDTYSYADLKRDQKTVWDGVSNNLALKHIRSMQKGDAALIYHTGDEKAVIGLAKIISDPYPDPKHKDGRLVVMDIEVQKRLARPVSLEEIKKDPTFKDFALVRMPRLSVMPVSDAQWEALLALAK